MLLLLAALVVAAAQPASITRWRAVASRERLLERAANSLLARHVVAAGEGWAWRSSIQAPHYFTDRDVGAAGIAMGLLAAYNTTHRQRYLEGRGTERVADQGVADGQSPAVGRAAQRHAQTARRRPALVHHQATQPWCHHR